MQNDERLRLDLEAAGWGGEAIDAGLRACRASADEAWAATGLSRWAGAYRDRLGLLPPSDPILLSRLVPVFASSRFLTRELVSRPRLALHLWRTPFFDVAKPVTRMRRELARVLARQPPGDEAALLRALRRFKYREFLRLASRELSFHLPAAGASRAGGGSLPDVAAELSNLARVCIDASLDACARALVPRYGLPSGGGDRPALGLCALGMGKLGAGELNFSSDVDLILVYREEGETSGGSEGKLSNRQFYARVAEALLRALSSRTEDGFVFRTDLDLRPEGRAGAIALSAEQAYRYYEAKGRTWERAALLKARAVAGDLEVGEGLLSDLQPFVYRRYLDLEAVEEIRAMKARIELESAAGARDLKLGPGGIRSAEFVVVALLLLHAGKDARLRERQTLAALDKLLFAGRLSALDRDRLAAAWMLLRRAEHRVQMVDERQTHKLPGGEADRLRLARQLGFADYEAFEEELRIHRGHVEEIFADLLGASGARPRQRDPLLGRALDPSAPPPERIEALRARGFLDPATSLGELQRLERRPDTPFSDRPPLSLDGQAEQLFAEIARTPDPDQALRHLAEFASSLRDPLPWFELLAEHPATARLLLELFGTSDFLSRYFLRHPELVDGLIRRDAVAPRKGITAMDAELVARLRTKFDLEAKLAGLRRFKNEEHLRIGLHDVSGELSVEEVMDELTCVADLCLRECLRLAREEQVERYGEPGGGSRLAVFGLGKLGGRELGYQSDLDLIFVYGHSEGESAGGSRGSVGNPEWFARLAQRLLSHLQVPLREGFLYRIDTRLRPSGSQGALVVSRDALAAYHRREGALWERQALLRTRHVAGDAAVAEAALREVIEPAVFRPDEDPAALAVEIAAMRARMETEASGERQGLRNPKTGYGGLVDIEFLAQWLQLTHGARDPSLRHRSTLATLRAMAAAGHLHEGDAAWLQEAYRFLRRLELRLQIGHDRAVGTLPASELELGRLARRMGFAGPRAAQSLRAEYARVTSGVRETFRKVMGLP